MPPNGQVLLTGGTLIDGTGAAPRADSDVLFEPDRILAVGADAKSVASPDVELWDVSGKIVMPGLIDAHCHVTFGEPASNDELFFHRPQSTSMLLAAFNVVKLLRAGITGFLDADCIYDLGPALRDGIEAGLVEGPRMKSGMNALLTSSGGTAGRLIPDGILLTPAGDVRVTKVAIEPVWWLPGVARRFGIAETDLRRSLFEQTGGMFPELVTRPDQHVFLPPIGGMTVYLFGDTRKLGKPSTKIACRVHDECNGSDVFGSDICTCRPYLAHGIEVCIETAQQGGVGVIVYNRKEGRALGEVTKFLVYNARKRQQGGDRAESYFERTECVAGVSDMRFQELMPDVLHWLGITRIDRLVSMSNMKYTPIVASGIAVVERVPIPEALIPADASVEMDAKKAAGYFTSDVPDAAALKVAKGRGLRE